MDSVADLEALRFTEDGHIDVTIRQICAQGHRAKHERLDLSDVRLSGSHMAL